MALSCADRRTCHSATLLGHQVRSELAAPTTCSERCNQTWNGETCRREHCSDPCSAWRGSHAVDVRRLDWQLGNLRGVAQEWGGRELANEHRADGNGLASRQQGLWRSNVGALKEVQWRVEYLRPCGSAPRPTRLWLCSLGAIDRGQLPSSDTDTSVCHFYSTTTMVVNGFAPFRAVGLRQITPRESVPKLHGRLPAPTMTCLCAE
mmetsp:Transcript_5809/g.12722  ORF Transcript_5809/g.12722 Transcript_5809/m.12722 type:complete len:206 (+) Transcript_5809:1506-2123(+)